MEQITGQVEDVRVINQGWGVVTLLHGSAQERASVTCHPLGFDVGDTIAVTGAWREHPRWGRQFKASEIEVLVPTDASGAIAWLAGRLPNVGRKLAAAMVARWPLPELWDVLEHEPSKLVDLRGITPARAEAIHAAYVAKLPERDRIVRFKKYGLTDAQIAKLLDAFGDDAFEMMRQDPYCLIDLVDGFGFKRSDAIALRLGLPIDHPSRIKAALQHMLREAAARGNTYVPGGKLCKVAAKLIEPVPVEAIREQAFELIRAGDAVKRGAWVYRPKLARAEESLAASVRRLVAGRAAG